MIFNCWFLSAFEKATATSPPVSFSSWVTSVCYATRSDKRWSFTDQLHQTRDLMLLNSIEDSLFAIEVFRYLKDKYYTITIVDPLLLSLCFFKILLVLSSSSLSSVHHVRHHHHHHHHHRHRHRHQSTSSLLLLLLLLLLLCRQFKTSGCQIQLKIAKAGRRTVSNRVFFFKKIIILINLPIRNIKYYYVHGLLPGMSYITCKICKLITVLNLSYTVP